MGDANGQKGIDEINTLPVANPVGTQNPYSRPWNGDGEKRR